MTTTLFLGQDIGFCLELGVWVHRLWLAKNLTTLNAFTVDTAQQNTNVVASFTGIQQLAEHFNACAGRLLGVLNANDFDFVANIDHATFNTASHNSTTARDREHVLDWHQER